MSDDATGAEESTDSPAPARPADPAGGVSRRALFGIVGAGAAGLAVGGAGGAGIAAAVASQAGVDSARSYPFDGTHQAGITTPAQDRLQFAVFDMQPGATRDDLISLLQDWTVAARAMAAGDEVGETGATGGSSYAPPDDTGEAMDLPASGLTITFGFGPTLFSDSDGVDRFGIAGARPSALVALPRFSGDALDPALTGGDLAIQACADDPQVAVHAIRNLSRIAFGRASIRWSQLGFGRTSSTSTSQVTARNLFGFKDGTQNIKAEEPAALDEHVWVTGGSPAWLTGGSYLVVRKIRMIIESWDRQQLQEQERVIGRSKREGAPLSGGTEFTEPDFAATGAADEQLIDQRAHVRLAHPSVNSGVRLLRRGYNYVDGNDALGRLDAGLFFMSYQSDPAHFVTVQRSLSSDDLNEYIQHVGSAVFAIPPGVSSDGWIGQTLLA
jgi:deferrochelatase/peroxidase EfeB